MSERKKRFALTTPLIVALIVIVSAGIAFAALAIATHTHLVTWTEKASAEFELYLDDVLYLDTTAIAFEDVIAGATETKFVKIVNVGNVDISMALTVTTPPTEGALAWDLDGAVIPVDDEVSGILTLTVGTTTVSNSCHIEIEATEVS